jgi:peptidoglycan/xylan/chitin deacetylase (PgdA/CDA1 family)
MTPRILCYHAVSTEWPHRLAIDPAQLERQVRSVLRRGYRGGSLADAVAGRHRVLHVTFDDAFANLEQALPRLERLGVPVTVFACTAYADDGRPLDIPELAEDARRSPDGLRTMTWDQLRELVERGVEVASHTCTHPHLPRLDDDELDRELRASRERLEEELGRPCPYVAYPYGDTDQRVGAAARRAGYDAGFALGPRRRGDRYAVPRADLYHADDVVRTTVKTTPLWHLAAGAARAARR